FDQQIADIFTDDRLIARLTMLFGGLALLLATVGLYGVTAYMVALRTSEIGIRMALGARRGTVVGLVLREVLLLAGSAMATTVPLAILATRTVRSQLFGVSVADPAVYGGAILTPRSQGLCFAPESPPTLPCR
ncbi:MAG TPA: FtsX-like permease family protein, partial [Silvibacterium sp.]|nr:FtsX-like permease family protein [Silvibacterium sp.]